MKQLKKNSTFIRQKSSKIIREKHRRTCPLICRKQTPFCTSLYFCCVRLKKKLKLSKDLQLGRDSSGSVRIREGRACVCVWGGCHWLVGSIICWTGRPVTPPLREAANEEKGCSVVLCSDPTNPPCPPCWLPLITPHNENTPHPHPSTPTPSSLFPPGFLTF